MELEFVIEGVSDPRLAKEIRERVRQVCKDAERPGDQLPDLVAEQMRVWL